MSGTPDAEPKVSPPAALKAPKWETDTKDRVRAGLRGAQKSLPQLISRDAVEGDTRLFVTQFLCEGLGYDLYEDLTAEYAVKGEFADYGIRIDKQLVAFVEVKRITTKLNPRHLRQVEMYAINEGVEWAFLTNGQQWQVYHLASAPPKLQKTGVNVPLVQVDLTLEVDLLGDETPAKKVERLFWLTRESMKRHQIDDLWRAASAMSPRSLADVLTSEAILEAIRRELRKKTGHNADPSEIADLLKTTVIRPDCLK